MIFFFFFHFEAQQNTNFAETFHFQIFAFAGINTTTNHLRYFNNGQTALSINESFLVYLVGIHIALQHVWNVNYQKLFLRKLFEALQLSHKRNKTSLYVLFYWSSWKLPNIVENIREKEKPQENLSCSKLAQNSVAS